MPTTLTSIYERTKKVIIKASSLETDKYLDRNDYRHSGITALNLALRTPGYRKGRIVEIFGPEHSGKTLMAHLAVIAEQKINKKPSLFGDYEWSFDRNWFQTLGGDLNLLDIHVPDPKEDSMESIYDVLLYQIRTGKYSFAVLDSIVGPALIPKNIQEKFMQDNRDVALEARINQDFLKKAYGLCIQTDTTLIVTNHIRDAVGVMFGDPETTPGGKALKFYAEQRIRIGTPQQRTKDGHKAPGKIRKNKRGASAGWTFEFGLNYKNGVDNFGDMMKYLEMNELIPAPIDKEKPKISAAIRKDWAVYNKYEDAILNKINLKPVDMESLSSSKITEHEDLKDYEDDIPTEITEEDKKIIENAEKEKVPQ